ncbi:MAG: ABC transporter ATP-binding protein, partial [Bacteroidales bacterium]|nr:ABC transporter ATP-binding protein [Bacteroidales bacterium]
MKEFLQILKRFAKPYSGNLFGSVFLNVFSAVFNIFSFALIIPLLRILFKMDTASYEFIPISEFDMSNFFNYALNDLNWFFTDMMKTHSGSSVLLMIGGFLAVMTALKCSCYFGASAVMIPLRTGIVRDLRTQVYNKLMSLPLGFFSDERKGDIVARMSGDVNEIENSIGSVLDMLIKNPILILFYFGTLIAINWKLTVFTLTVVPLIAWGMGALGKTLKRKSLAAQNKWSDTMSQLDESLGGLRVIKAFNAEDKMKSRFLETCNEYRRIFSRVATRQASAHPVSEFLGTIMIMAVLWFGGTLILNGSNMIDAPTFIFYMTILYSVLQPIKDLSKATYQIPKGLASMERIDKILLAENTIKDPAEPKEISSFESSIKFENVSFSYNGMKEVLSDINIEIEKGRTVAIVGQSGSGKSTLVDLIPRFYDVGSGRITIDGKDVRELAGSDLRELMGNGNQEAILFTD